MRFQATTTWLLTSQLAAAACLLGANFALAQDAGDGSTDNPSDAAAELEVVENPTVRAVLESPRTTPADHAQAVFALIDLGEAERAAPVMAELLKLNIDDQAKAALVAQFGSARFMKLARSTGVGDGAAEFAAACLQAANKQATSPERLAKLVEQLGSDSERRQAAAIAELKRSGMAGVEYCLGQLAEADASQQNRLREALVALAPESRPAVVALLDSPDSNLRKQAAWALGQLQDDRAAPLLAAAAVLEPSDSEAGRAAQWAFRKISGQPSTTSAALRLINTALRNARSGVPPARPDGDGMIAVYQRDNSVPLATKPTLMPAVDATIVHAARLARARHQIDPANQHSLRVAMVLNLESQSLFANTEITPPQLDSLAPSSAPNPSLNAALDDALDGRHAGAAAALAAALGERGDRGVLMTHDGRPSPLADALQAPHPRVRFAALQGVMKLNPQTPFPGSSRVADALVDFARGGGKRLAVIASPNTGRAATIAGYLASEGIEGLATNRGTQAIALAGESTDVELVLVDLAVLDPNVRETVFRLRRQTTSGLAPIGLLAPAGRLVEAKRIASEHRHVLAFSRPQSIEATAEIAQSLAKVAPAGWPSAEQRADQAKTARDWLAKLLAEGPSFYNLRGRDTELQTALARNHDEASIAGLALLGTPISQQELLNLVSLPTAPIATREAAAKAFGRSVGQFGVLLTTTQIKEQYNRYNASESADAPTQQVLASVLDTIETQRNREQPAADSGP